MTKVWWLFPLVIMPLVGVLLLISWLMIVDYLPEHQKGLSVLALMCAVAIPGFAYVFLTSRKAKKAARRNRLDKV